MIGTSELLIIITGFILGFAGTGFWVWALIDCVKNEPPESQEKLVWVIIIIFTHIIGAAMYFIIRRPQRRAKQTPG